jgi:hypothetical protein
MNKAIYFIPFAFNALATDLPSDYQIHTLVKGETLSQLLHEKGFTPLWGSGNWVDKTLNLNHLNQDTAYKVKKGYPVFLPLRKDQDLISLKKSIDLIKTDSVSINESARIRSGLFGNTISKHQDVYLELDYYSSDFKLQETNVSLNQNYGMGLKVEGRNDYTIGKLKYNYTGSVFIYNHGAGKFKNNDNISSQFTPTYLLDTAIEFKSPEIGFHFGPTMRVEEKSRIEQSDELMIMRRDRTAWLGFDFTKRIAIDHLYYQTNMGYRKKFIGQNLNADKLFTASQLYFGAKVNLSTNYDMALKYSKTTYENIGIKSENALGINFSYNLR